LKNLPTEEPPPEMRRRRRLRGGELRRKEPAEAPKKAQPAEGSWTRFIRPHRGIGRGRSERVAALQRSVAGDPLDRCSQPRTYSTARRCATRGRALGRGKVEPGGVGSTATLSPKSCFQPDDLDMAWKSKCTRASVRAVAVARGRILRPRFAVMKGFHAVRDGAWSPLLTMG